MAEITSNALSRATVEDLFSRYDSELVPRGQKILNFRYRNVRDHSGITMMHLALDCGLNEAVPIIVKEEADDEWVTSAWELLGSADEASLAIAQVVYADFLNEVKILADRGFAEITFEVPDGEAGERYFVPQPPSVQ